MVKVITGDPLSLKGSTLFQDKDEKDNRIQGGPGAISEISDFVYGGDHYYQIGLSRESVEGSFVIPGRTRFTDNVSVGATVLTVDTTVGFPTTGVLNCIDKNGTIGVVTYTDKSSTQFIGVDPMITDYAIGNEVRYSNVAYGYSADNINDKIEVVITGVLANMQLPPDGIYFEQGDKIRVGTPGLLTSPEDPNF